MKFKIGDTVDYNDQVDSFKSCTVVGYNKDHNAYIIQIPEKYEFGWTSDEFHKKYYEVKAGTKRCWCAQESCLTLSKTSKKSTYVTTTAFKIGDRVDCKYLQHLFEACTVIGFDKENNIYIIKIPEKYNCGWTSGEYDKLRYGIKAGTKRCLYAFESRLTLSKPNNRGKNPRGKNGKFIKTNTLEDRVTALEEYIGKIKTLLNI